MLLRRSHRRLCTVFGIPSVLPNLHYILLICASLPYVIGVGVFEVKLREIWNPGGRDMNQRCCSGSESNGVCSSPCRTVFYTCLRQYPRPAHPADCTYGYNISRVYDANSFVLTTNNIASFPFTANWPGSFSLKVTAKVAGSRKTIITALINKPSFGSSLKWSNFTHVVNKANGAKIRLSLSYRFICAPNNYGSNCSKTCTPRNDQYGHFTCDADGNIVCLPGWGGTSSDKYCENPICNPGCGRNGRCVGPNACSCSSGWRGPTCNECEVYPGCVHGTCQKKWECNCKSGWGGLYCDLELDYCGRNNPCKNGDCRNIGAPGRYKCYCNKGYGGLNCDSELNECASNPCQNRGNCTDQFADFSCSCPAGFRGKQCEINIDDCVANACKNGGTCVDGVRSYSCRCPAGYSGQACEVILPRTTRQPSVTVHPRSNTTGNNGNSSIIGGQSKGKSSAGWNELQIILPIIFGVLIIICLIVACALWRIHRKRPRCCCCCLSTSTPSRDSEEPNTRTDIKQIDPSDVNRSSDMDLKRCRVGTSKSKNNHPDIIINFVPSRSNQKNVNSDKGSHRISKEKQVAKTSSTEDSRIAKPLNRAQETVT